MGLDQQVSETVLTKKFRVANAPTLISRVASGAPIAFTHLRNPQRGRTQYSPPADVFACHVFLSDAYFSRIWVAGRPKGPRYIARGNFAIFDLKDSGALSLDNGFDAVRICLPQVALDELADDRGFQPIPELRVQNSGSFDLVMLRLAQAAVASLAEPGHSSALFADYLGLAVYDHLIHTHGTAPVTERARRGGLSPRHLRLTREFIDANLAGDPSIAQLAEQCGLSKRYFARAFKQTTGMPPHQWLIQRRIERAKQFLQDPDRDLAEIAVSCGFVDQSHFTRAFSKREGPGPGTWRRRLGIRSPTS